MNSRITLVLLSTAALVAACSKPDTQSYKDQLVAADKAFSAKSQKEGPKAAFLAFASADAKFLSVIPTGADGVNTIFKRLPANATLTWEPAFVDASVSGDIGYTWGRYTLTIPIPKKGVGPLIEMGTYSTIWKRESGGWKVVLDGGHADGEH